MGFVRFEGGHLVEGVDTRVGAAGTRHLGNGRTFNSGQNRFQRALNGGQAGLDLPAVKGSAVVCQIDSNAAHHTGREPGFTTGMPCRHRGQASG